MPEHDSDEPRPVAPPSGGAAPPVGTRGYRAAPRVLELGDGFYDEVTAAAFPSLRPRFRNDRAAASVGLDGLDGEAWERHFARFEPLPDNLLRPLALRYHGHQFDAYNPDLGDGRGFLYAQLEDDRGRLLDLGTKGTGRTPWSRGGDGRLTLKGGVREVLATEMLEALGVDTSRSFSLFETGEALERGDEPSPTRSSVLVRLSHSHVRFGSFQRHAYARDVARIQRLLEYSVRHLAPSSARPTLAETAVAFVEDVAVKSAAMVAGWMVSGFVHGVLNSDNMNVTGESFDYGPWRFLPRYDPDFVAAYFDHGGLYAFGRQPTAVFRNVTRLASALAALAPDAPFASALAAYEPALLRGVHARLAARLGVAPRGHDEDDALLDAVYTFLGAVPVPYDRFFFDWYGGLASEARARAGAAASLYAGDAFDALRARLAPYAPRDPSRLDLAYFRGDGPCTMTIDEVERVWAAIAARDDWGPFESKIAAVRAMGEAIG